MAKTNVIRVQTASPSMMALADQKLAAARGAVTRGALEEVASYYREIQRQVDAFDTGVGLKIRAIVENLVVTINTSTSGGTAFVDFRVPENEDLVVDEVRGYLSFNAWTGETLSITGLGNPMPRDRIYIKGYNCRIALKNQDTKLDILSGTNDLSLGDILAAAGGAPLQFGIGHRHPGLVIPHGNTVRMTATLRDTTSSLIGGASDYGVSLVGKYVSRPRR